MAKYSLIKNSDDAILIDGRDFSQSRPTNPTLLTDKFGPSKETRWVLYVLDPIPAHDPATQKIVRGNTVTATEHHVTAVAAALTAEELADLAASAARESKQMNVRDSVATLRAWAVEGRGVTVTPGNAVVVLQQMVNRQSTFFDNFADMVEGFRFDRTAIAAALRGPVR